MKTNKYVVMGLLAALSMAGCSNDETEVTPVAAADVRISAGLADAETKAVINAGYDEKLDVMFGYLEGSGSSFSKWYPGVRMAGAGNQFVSFDETLKYNSYTSTKTTMAGIYPRPASGGSVSSPIAYKVDGDMDLMATESQTADKDNPFVPFMFRHQLTQLQVKCVGSDEAIKAWGNIKSVKVANQAVNLQLKVVPGVTPSLSKSNSSTESLSFFNCPSKIVTAKEENPQIGYCMIYPEDNLGTAANALTLEVMTDYDGTNPDNPRTLNSAKRITVNNISKGARQGYAHLITLIFTVDGEIVIEADIAPWTPGSSTSTVIKPS